MSTQRFTEGALTLELKDENGEVQVVWFGKSTAREPGKFILPVLVQAIDLCATQAKPLILDFQNVGYMNSSTITPIIRVLDKAKHAANAVRVIYKKDLRWQELSFSALAVFQTHDHRIEVRGV